jgi:UDP-2,3-diacylglucosamine pyrophosphatase LpxH
VLDRIRRLGESREVVWIQGNHDGPPSFLSRLLGLPVLDSYTFPYRGGKVLVTHGDEFDDFQQNVRGLKRLKKLRNAFYGFAIWFDAPRKAAISWAQRSTRVFARAAEKVKHKAVLRALEEGASCVVTGHTHRRDEEVISGVTYLNPSSWLTPNPAYVLFDDDLPAPRLVVCGARKRKTLRRKVRVGVKRARRNLTSRLKTAVREHPG